MAQKKAKSRTQRTGKQKTGVVVNATKKGTESPTAKKSAKMPRNYKSAVDAVSKYRQLRAAGKIGKITAMEELAQFVGKKGSVLQKKVKSEKGKREFAAAVEKVKKEVGRRPGTKTLKRYEKKAQGILEKATKTYVQKQVPDNRFKKKAREAAAQYGRMVDIFASDSYDKLKNMSMGVGSDTVEMLAKMELDEPDIEKFLEEIAQTINDLPPAAVGLAMQDDFWQNTAKLMEWAANSDSNLQFKDIFTAYIQSDNITGFEDALQNYAELGDTSVPFSEVWAELQDSLDPGNMETMEEIIEEKKQQ